MTASPQPSDPPRRREEAGSAPADVAARVVLRAGLILLVVAVVVVPFVWLTAPLYDVGMLWEAGSRMRAGGAELYAAPEDPWNRVAPYPWPPLFAALFAPLTFLPRAWGYGVWAALQGVAVVVGLVASVRAAGPALKDARRRALSMVLVAVSGALVVHVNEGQVNLLVLAAAAGGVGLVGRGRPWAGGALVALAAHMKLIPVVLVGVLVAGRRWRAAAAMAAGLAALTLVPAVWTVPARGPVDGLAAAVDMNVRYLTDEVLPRVVSHTPRGLGDAGVPNQSLSAVVRRWVGRGDPLTHYLDVERWVGRTAPLFRAASGSWPRWVPPLVAGLLFLGSLDVARRIGRGPAGLALAAGLALLAASLGNVLYWTHHAVVLALVVGPLCLLAPPRAWHLTGSAAALGFVATWIGALGAVPFVDTLAVVGVPAFATLGVWGLGWWGSVKYGGAAPGGPGDPWLESLEPEDDAWARVRR